ncbi:hypothetical protein FACS189474_1790 [Bacteroidia bacterium]|nr:hypothetical protein FACS189474_1790 [Bacteroidia bacterium]
MKENKFRNYFLIFLLLLISGNPAMGSDVKSAIVGIGLFLFVYLYKYISLNFKRKYFLYLSVFFFIFLVQYVNLGFVSIPFVLGFMIKIFIGGIIFCVLRENFSNYFFHAMFYVCLISIPFYLLQLFYGVSIFSHFYTFGVQNRSMVFFTIMDGIHHTRNAGMFWEPGAFQGYINLCLFMNFRTMPIILKNEKWKITIIIITLLTTQSTTGYIVFFILCMLYLFTYTKINRIRLSILATLLFILGYYVYNQYDFLGEKMEKQYDSALLLGGDFRNDRFGSFLFDMHYIKKNPLTGNGFHEKTRFADHPELQNIPLGHGNGFSNFLACAGLLGTFWYLYMIIRFQKKPDSLFLCLVVIVLLQGEQFLNYSFWLGLPFYMSSSLSKS